MLLPHICCPVAKEMAADSSNDEAEEGDHPKKEPLSPASSTISDDENDGKTLGKIVVNHTRINIKRLGSCSSDVQHFFLLQTRMRITMQRSSTQHWSKKIFCQMMIVWILTQWLIFLPIELIMDMRRTYLQPMQVIGLKMSHESWPLIFLRFTLH